MKKILFLTNGHGEDLVAAELIKLLNGQAEMSALPLVGQGKAFNGLTAKVLGPRQELPSGGFSLRNLWFLVKDVCSGFIGSTRQHLALLKELAGKFDLTVAVGDIVPLIAALKVKAPFIFVGVNKSSYYRWFGYNYTPWEKYLLQRYALKVFVRDELTEKRLRTRGIKIKSAEYVGNPLMDCLGNMSRLPSPMPRKGTVTIGFLPGTREDAEINLEDFEAIAAEIAKTRNSRTEVRFITATRVETVPDRFQNKPFEQVLAESDLIIGLSGTGNEQAAGYGIPVVSFYGRGSQYNRRFALAQRQLLGEALCLVRDNDPMIIAAQAWELLRDPKKMEQMEKAGRERMGAPGAVQKIADFILKT